MSIDLEIRVKKTLTAYGGDLVFVKKKLIRIKQLLNKNISNTNPNVHKQSKKKKNEKMIRIIQNKFKI